jgi:glutathione synthase/RimK-type ligase-like ATP-grasp enzyme
MSKIAIIHDDHHPLLDKIQERLLNRGAEPVLVSWKQLAIGMGLPSALEGISAIYLDRMGERTSSYTTQIELLNEIVCAPIVNAPKPYAIARNKALTARKLASLGIPTPTSAIVYDCHQFNAFRSANPNDFYVVKSIYGCCAKDVYIVAFDATSDQLQSLLDRDGIAVIQSFVLNPLRYIWRIDVVDGQIIVANQRFSFNSDDEMPMCNGTLGGRIQFWNPKEIPNAVRDLALRTVKGLDLTVAGVDILPDADGNLFVLEANPEPDITLDRFEFPFAIADYLWSLT